MKTLTLMLLGLVSFSVVSADEIKVPQEYINLTQGIEKFTLDNGLRVIVAKRPDAPVFNAELWVKVGSSDELQSHSGAAHLLEHMAFKGTDSIGTEDFSKEKDLLKKEDELMESIRNGAINSKEELKKVHTELDKIWKNGEYTKLLEQRGAKGLNAATSADYTMYTVSLPSSELEFWFFMESERLLNPVFRQFYKELEVVHEERRMRTEDDPSGKLYEALLGTAYWNHPYHSPTIGWKEDLVNLKRSDVMYLHNTYYRPDNMVVVISGDVEMDQVKDLAQRYLGRIKKSDQKLPTHKVNFIKQNGERIVKVKFKSEPEFLMGYHKPTYPNPASAHLSLLYSILDEGRSSPFQKILVQDKQIASNVYTTEGPGQRYDPLFLIGGAPTEKSDVNLLIKEIDHLLNNIEITDLMLSSAKKRIKVQILSALSTNSGLSSMLGERDVIYGDWKDIFTELEQIDKTTVKDIKAAIKEYLVASNRTIAVIQNEKE